MAGVTGYSFIGMRQAIFRRVGASPGLAVFLQRFGLTRFFTVMAIAGRERIDDLNDLPLDLLIDHRALKQTLAAPLEAPLAKRRYQDRKRRAAFRRGGAGSFQTGPRLDRAVAI